MVLLAKATIEVAAIVESTQFGRGSGGQVSFVKQMRVKPDAIEDWTVVIP
jgi:hypothetical protein